LEYNVLTTKNAKIAEKGGILCTLCVLCGSSSVVQAAVQSPEKLLANRMIAMCYPVFEIPATWGGFDAEPPRNRRWSRRSRAHCPAYGPLRDAKRTPGSWRRSAIMGWRSLRGCLIARRLTGDKLEVCAQLRNSLSDYLSVAGSREVVAGGAGGKATACRVGPEPCRAVEDRGRAQAGQ
jgi:hypothetical protein